MVVPAISILMCKQPQCCQGNFYCFYGHGSLFDFLILLKSKSLSAQNCKSLCHSVGTFGVCIRMKILPKHSRYTIFNHTTNSLLTTPVPGFPRKHMCGGWRLGTWRPRARRFSLSKVPLAHRRNCNLRGSRPTIGCSAASNAAIMLCPLLLCCLSSCTCNRLRSLSLLGLFGRWLSGVWASCTCQSPIPSKWLWVFTKSNTE